MPGNLGFDTLVVPPVQPLQRLFDFRIVRFTECGKDDAVKPLLTEVFPSLAAVPYSAE